MRIRSWVAGVAMAFTFLLGVVYGAWLSTPDMKSAEVAPKPRFIRNVNSGAYKVQDGWMIVMDGKNVLRIDCASSVVIPQ